ncbi:MAG: DUF2735 domain-containing protein [Xanthobacteraceae bacterium]
MTTTREFGTARIYQFPRGGRAALADRRDDAKRVAEFAQARTAKVAAGDCWYHEEAIREADRLRKN